MPRPRGGRPRFRVTEGARLFHIIIAAVAFAFASCCFVAAATTGPTAPPSPASGEPLFPLGPPGDCSPAGVSMNVLPLSRDEAESCFAAFAFAGGGAKSKRGECRVPKPAAKTPPAAKTAAPAAETVFFSWSPLSESDSNSTTTLLDTTGTPVKPARMPDSLFPSSSKSAPSSSPLRSFSPSPSPSHSAAPSPSSPPPSLPSSFAVVAGRLLLEAAGNYSFFLSSDGLSAMDFGAGEAEEEEGRGSGGKGKNEANATTTLALSRRSPLWPFPFLLVSAPWAVDFSIAYLPDPAAASHFLTLEWEFREGSGGGGGGQGRSGSAAAAAERSSSSSAPPLSPLPLPPRGNRRAIERGAVWPSALVGPKCQQKG